MQEGLEKTARILSESQTIRAWRRLADTIKHLTRESRIVKGAGHLATALDKLLRGPQLRSALAGSSLLRVGIALLVIGLPLLLALNIVTGTATKMQKACEATLVFMAFMVLFAAPGTDAEGSGSLFIRWVRSWWH